MLGVSCVRPAARPPVHPCGVTLLTDRQEGHLYFNMKSKNAVLDVILHAVFNLGVIFD